MILPYGLQQKPIAARWLCMQIALYEPDIPQNTGSLIRLSACMGTKLHVIEPCGFPFDVKQLKRVAMDYADLADITRHISWQAFLDFRRGKPGKLLLLTTRGDTYYTEQRFGKDDILLLGRESSGVPDHVRAQVDAQIKIPMHGASRSLNVALAASMVLGEALRQTNG
jgi:tRNA (cytidine/uridine-2'-O-)-methyltransferase